MAHPYRIREIAVQAGLSEATVDRVLNERGGVRASTVREVHRAIAELDRQQTQLRLSGRTFVVDLVVDAPPRFCAALRASLEAQLPMLQPATVRARFHLYDAAPAPALAATLDRIAGRGSHGVLLKAPDVPQVGAAVERLTRRGVPVVTLVTDLPASRRVAYAGVDNRAAGATAAYLLDRWTPARSPVMVVRSSASFRAEDEREMGFRSTLRTRSPRRRQVDVIDEDGRDERLRERVRTILADEPRVRGVYAMYSNGASPAAVLDAFADAGRPTPVCLVHDLDEQTRTLLLDGRLAGVLHHDLGQDLRRACQAVMRQHGALPGPVGSWTSGIAVVTPYNLPPGP